MRILYVFIFRLLFINSSIAQDESPIKIEQVNDFTWKYYQESDSVVLVKVYDMKGRTKHIKRYTDLSCKTEVGEWIDYYTNQKVSNKMYFKDGYPTGLWCQYTLFGKVKRAWDYNFSLDYVRELVEFDNYEVYTENSSSGSFVPVDVMPQFKGGDINKFRENLAKRIYPIPYMVEKYKGTGFHKIYVQFTVDMEGEVLDVVACNYGKKILEKDAVRLIKESPDWTPALQNNKPVKVRFAFPVNYFF
jgi:hypothetical protein